MELPTGATRHTAGLYADISAPSQALTSVLCTMHSTESHMTGNLAEGGKCEPGLDCYDALGGKVSYHVEKVTPGAAPRHKPIVCI